MQEAKGIRKCFIVISRCKLWRWDNSNVNVSYIAGLTRKMMSHVQIINFMWRIQDFLEGSANPKYWDTYIYYFGHLFLNTAWNWRKMDGEGVHAPNSSLDPPLGTSSWRNVINSWPLAPPCGQFCCPSSRSTDCQIPDYVSLRFSGNCVLLNCLFIFSK